MQYYEIDLNRLINKKKTKKANVTQQFIKIFDFSKKQNVVYTL